MYSTVIRQQHILLYFIAQKYYKTKGSNTERHKEQCASHVQNDVLETTRSHSAQAAQPSESA